MRTEAADRRCDADLQGLNLSEMHRREEVLKINCGCRISTVSSIIQLPFRSPVV